MYNINTRRNCNCIQKYEHTANVCYCPLKAGDVLKKIAEMKGPIESLEHKVIGKTRVFIDGDSKNCRRQECNMGNLICDAILDYVRLSIDNSIDNH